MIGSSPAAQRSPALRNAGGYAAKFKTPFAVLGIRTSGGSVTGVEYLTTDERAQAPTDVIAECACRQIERYLRSHFPSLPLDARAPACRACGSAVDDPSRRVENLRRVARRLATAARAAAPVAPIPSRW